MNVEIPESFTLIPLKSGEQMPKIIGNRQGLAGYVCEKFINGYFYGSSFKLLRA